jgi:hypothetical protein
MTTKKQLFETIEDIVIFSIMTAFAVWLLAHVLSALEKGYQSLVGVNPAQLGYWLLWAYLFLIIFGLFVFEAIHVVKSPVGARENPWVMRWCFFLLTWPVLVNKSYSTLREFDVQLADNLFASRFWVVACLFACVLAYNYGKNSERLKTSLAPVNPTGESKVK